MKRNMKMSEEMLASIPEYEPEPLEPITPEKLEELISEMRGSLQHGFATIESIWCTCQGNRELARGIEDPDEFEEIREAAEKLAYIANDIYQMSQGQ